MNPIEITSLSKTYTGKKRKFVEALRDLSLTVANGEIFGFLGPNGAGKSTTIKILAGLITATSGTASLCGRPASDPRARNHVGYLPENPSLYEYLTAREFLALCGRTFGMDEGAIGRESERVLELLDLREAADRPVRGYSKGMVQRLSLARTLLHDPDVYILDEPMSGLDPVGRALVKDIMKDLKSRGRTVFFSTHITADVEVVCDRVAVIVGGRLRTVSAVDELMESGIEGYSVQVKNCDAVLQVGLDAVHKASDVTEIYVPREQLKTFLEKLGTSGAEIHLIEPKRKDLEAFFLEILARDK
jgi:ABC-2 type transport system ATP-binding protein